MLQRVLLLCGQKSVVWVMPWTRPENVMKVSKYITSQTFLGSTNMGVNYHSEYVTQEQQQRPQSPTVTLTWHACKYKVHKPEDVPLVEFMYLVFTCMPGESYRRRLRSLLLYLCYVFWALINSLVDSARALGALFCSRFATFFWSSLLKSEPAWLCPEEV